MSNNIDQRIVEMQFNNKQFEQGISSSLKSLDTLEKGLKLDKASKGLANLQKAGKNFSLEGLATGVDAIAKKFSALGILGVTMMQRLSNAAITTGKQIVSALTIDPLRTGFREYETQMNAIQTILSNTRSKGTTIDDVNNALDELNAYADKTIYNFTEMTKNIGTFTAAGIDLDKSTAAIKGIANLAAVSGSSSQQASTAMYQLSQALSTGTVRLMDWNSVVNAGMGGEVFQNALKDTARVHKVAIDNIIKRQGSFRESLQEGWLTSEILLETLKKFTGDLTKEQIISMGYTEDQAQEILALGKDASDAATKVKTFTQLIDTLKEALGSGWTQSWENIFGNFEEARTLWTSISDVLGGVIGKNAEVRNELLSKWKEAGGREDLIQGLADVFSALWGIVLSVSEAMHDIFPKATVDNLLAVSSGVKKFGSYLKSILYYKNLIIGQNTSLWTGVDQPNSPPTILGGFISSLGIGTKGNEVKELQKGLASLGEDLGKAGIDGIFGPKTQAALKSYQEKKGLSATGILDKETYTSLFGDGSAANKGDLWANAGDSMLIFSDALDKIGRIAGGVFAIFHVGVQVFNFLWNIFKHVAVLLYPVASAFLTVGAAIGDAFVAFDDWLENSGIFSDWLSKVDKFLEPFGEAMSKAGKAILDFFGFGEAAESATDAIDTFPKLWNKIVTSVKSLVVWDKLTVAFEKVKTAFSGITPVLKDYYKKAKAYLGEKFTAFLGKVAETLPKIIESIGNAFVWLLDFIAPVIEKIPAFISTIKSFFKALLFDSVDESGNKVKGYFTKIKDFFTKLYSTIKSSEKIQKIWEKVKSFFSDLWATLSGFFSGSEAKETGAENAAKPVETLAEKLSAAWNKLWTFLKTAGDDTSAFFDKVGAGGIIGMVMGAIGVFSIFKLVSSLTGFFGGLKDIAKLIKNNIIGKGKGPSLSLGILQIAGAIGILVAALYFLGKMDEDVFKRGAIALGVIVGVLVAITVLAAKFLNKDMAKTIGTAGKAMLNLALAIAVIAVAIFVLGKMDLEELIQGGAAIAVILGMMGGFLYFMKNYGSTNVNYKGLVGLAIAIGILSVIAMLLGNMDRGKLAQGVVALGLIMAELGAFMIFVNKYGGSTTIKYGGLFAMAVAIGILALIARMIGGMDQGKFYTGMAGLTVIMVLMSGFMISVNKLGTANVVKYAGLIGMAVAVGLLASIVMALGGMKESALERGLGAVTVLMAGLTVMVVAFKGLTKGASGIKIGPALAIVVGLAALMIVFASVLKTIKGVDPLLVVAFAGGLSVAILALVTASAIANEMGGPGAMATGAFGVAAAIGVFAVSVIAIAAALSGLDSLFGGGVMRVLKKGAKIIKAIGEFIGSFIGGIIDGILGVSDMDQYSTDLDAYGKALASFSKSTEGITGEGVSGAVEASKMISAFADGLPKMGGLVGWLEGDQDLGQFAIDLGLFAAALSLIGPAVALIASYENIISDTDKALNVARMVHGFFSGLEMYPLNLYALDGYATAAAQLSSDMYLFGIGMKAFALGVGGLGDNTKIEADADKAILIAGIVHDFFVSLGQVPMQTSYLKGYNTAAATLSTDMKLFGIAIQSFAQNVAGLDSEETLELDTQKAIDVATLVHNFFQLLQPTIINQEPLTSYNSAASGLFLNMTEFGTAINTFKDTIKGLAKTSVKEDADKAVEAAIVVKDFIDSIGLVKIDPKSDALNNWKAAAPSEGGSAGTLFDNITAFGDAMSNLATGIDGISEMGLKPDLDAAVGFAKDIANFLVEIRDPTYAIERDKGALGVWWSGDTKANTLTDNMTALGEAFTTIRTGFSGLSSGNFKTDLAAAIQMAKDVSGLFTWIATEVVIQDDPDKAGFYGSTFDGVIAQMGVLASKIVEFNTTVEGVDTSKFTALSEGMKTITEAVINIGSGDQTEKVVAFQESLTAMTELLSADSEVKLDSTKFTEGLDAKTVSNAITDFAVTVGNALGGESSYLTDNLSTFNAAGSSLASSLNSGIGDGSTDSTGVDTLIGSMISKVKTYIDDFRTVGYSLGMGLKEGLKNSQVLAVEAAKAVAQAMLRKVREIFGTNSPSKEFAEIGRYNNLGLAEGTTRYAYLVERASEGLGKTALSSTKRVLANMASLVNENMNPTPVIRPVVDLSDVTSGSRAITGLLSRKGTISVDSVQSKALAASINVSRATRVQNGSSSGPIEGNGVSSPDAMPSISGNNFYINDKQDIIDLGSELAVNLKRLQRGFGSTQ